MPSATSSTSRADTHHAQTPSHPLPPPRKTRTVRRRGRGRNDFGSDDELVREVGTDSESDDDDHSDDDSSTDSDTEPVSEDILSATHSRILTPNTTQSSADVPSLNGSASKPSQGVDGPRAPFFSDAGNWSEMVAEENAHGPADLPVIEFADFTSPPIDQRSKPTPQRKPSKPSKRPPVKRAASAPTATVDRPAVHSPPASEQLEESQPEPTSDQPFASTSRQSSRAGFRRPPGQSARQAYQQRLESDPSYVPTVGGFWGHDDRLMDKDLRSLSGWWRGRWQGRGRGRGFGFIRGRGRGGNFAAPAPALHASRSEDGLTTQEKPAVELPPVEQPWTHDGFEEMKKRDEKRREAQQQPTPRPTRGFAPLRGRGGFSAGRGRGGAVRGGGVSSPSSRSTATAAAASVPGKIWYAMKPEYPWTKHLETSLFHDTGPKPRPGNNSTYRVKLPNVEAQIVRGSPRVAKRPKSLPPSEPQGSEDGEKNIVVRLPKWTAKEKVVQPGPVSVATAEEHRIEDFFTVRPGLVPPRASIVDVKLPSTSATVESPKVASTAGSSQQPAESSATLPSPALLPAQEQPTQSAPAVVDGVLHGHQDTAAPTLLKADTPHAPDAQEVPGSRRTLPPVPPPLQTVFTPPQSSPYSSPYGYGSPLPPGIAISQHGMAYEVATGRPVYLSAPIYTPRPLAHGMMTPPGVPFVPGHMHHHSTGSPDFLSAPHTPPLNGFIDPTTGSPIFAFPRQSSRVEIRAPSTQPETKTTKSQRRPSSLRTSAAAYEPSSPVNEAQLSAPRTEHYPSHNASEVQGDASATSEQHMDPAMFNYTAYPQPYYYPDQYGYSQYYDMPQMPQYEMYQTDPQASQSVYY
ncbi:hypothetical protein L210DRAFT_2364342 [Boletus edulis BED1]|uniref:Btz domain-containing protein n=1 Tax=Boletus edulis BED1 TaxID=1328754 RepID=A0AAD4BRA9_BOLED|nr:hypothetical protein L210DRAFT_2364342 [Boletus edulis BED1]